MESRNCGEKKISVCDEILSMKSDSFGVDMEPFSHLTFNSRFNLQRSLIRKGLQSEEEKMSSPSVDNERDVISSPKGNLPPPITVATEPQIHHQISIITGVTTPTTTGTPTKNRLVGKRSNSFKHTTSIVNPRRIMLLFATLSSMGTILLIYFTLSIAKRIGDENLLD